MAKYLLTLTVLYVLGAVVAKGFNKSAAIEAFLTKAGVCKSEVGATDADLGEMIAKQSASTSQGKCLRACVMKKYDVMNDNGKFVPAVAERHAEIYTDSNVNKYKIAIEVIRACSGHNVSGDHCEAAEEYCECFKEQAAARGIKDFRI